MRRQPIGSLVHFFGLTREDGGHVLNATDGKRCGKATLEGKYAVMVRKMAPDPKGGEDPVLASPEHYASQETTPLRATVAKGRNSLDFNLSSNQTGGGAKP